MSGKEESEVQPQLVPGHRRQLEAAQRLEFGGEHSFGRLFVGDHRLGRHLLGVLQRRLDGPHWLGG